VYRQSKGKDRGGIRRA
jgi:hypothetical protein